MRGMINNFLSENDRLELISIISDLEYNQNVNNKHIKEISEGLNGRVWMFDLTRTPPSEYISKFQSDGNIRYVEEGHIFNRIRDNISNSLNIPNLDVFLQIIDQNIGGKINPHYDTSMDGRINFKCNISLISNPYKLWIDGDFLDIKENDLYYFEASLYKHWTEEFQNKRIILSYGFVLKYEDLGWDCNHPRVRMSRRISKYFQSTDR
jgi:hypothetical protein